LKDNQVKRWARFVKENPDKWKRIHTEFINAQFEKSLKFYERLKKTKNGRQKIIKLFNIKNLDGFPSLKH